MQCMRPPVLRGASLWRTGSRPALQYEFLTNRVLNRSHFRRAQSVLPTPQRFSRLLSKPLPFSCLTCVKLGQSFLTLSKSFRDTRHSTTLPSRRSREITAAPRRSLNLFGPFPSDAPLVPMNVSKRLTHYMALSPIAFRHNLRLPIAPARA